MSSRSIDQLHPQLRAAIPKIQDAMHAIGFPVMITATVRTTEEQQALYAQGRTRPGPVVTNADGIRAKSNHQLREDGFGHAVDFAFLVDNKPSWDLHLPWRAFGEIGKALGLKWGGDWSSIVDLPHLEL